MRLSTNMASTAACASSSVHGDNHAFARRQTVRLDDDGCALGVDVRMGGAGFGEGLELG